MSQPGPHSCLSGCTFQGIPRSALRSCSSLRRLPTPGAPARRPNHRAHLLPRGSHRSRPGWGGNPGGWRSPSWPLSSCVHNPAGHLRRSLSPSVCTRSPSRSDRHQVGTLPPFSAAGILPGLLLMSCEEAPRPPGRLGGSSGPRQAQPCPLSGSLRFSGIARCFVCRFSPILTWIQTR